MDYLSARQIANDIASGKLDSAAITAHYLAQIERFNPQLNAFVDVYAERATAAAAAHDRIRDRDPDQCGPLHGVPISIKECFLLAGTGTTLNYPPLKQFKAEQTSLLVKRLLDAGAIILGKTNVPTLLSDAQTFGPIYPRCNNPHDLSRTPGGSTGGGAAALAADMCALELGSDIGGSIRNPSNFCGLFGLKPTENGHPLDGHVPPMPNSQLGFSAMNSTGPLARTATDLKLAYEVLYQPDYQHRLYLPQATQKAVPNTLQEMHFGVLESLYGLQPGTEVQAAMTQMKAGLEAAGAKVTPIQIDPQLTERLLLLWVKLFGFVMGQNLSWFIRKVFYMSFRQALSDSSLNARKAFKTGLSLDFVEFSRCLAERDEMIAEINQLYAPFDAVLSPTSLGPAFEHNPKHGKILLDGEQVPYVDYCFLFVALYNLTGQPVLSVPTGPQQSGLPIGLSFATEHHNEALLLKLGELLEQQGLAQTLSTLPAGLSQS
ncbi:amidase [Pseudidiomarina taiwanensis]|uniref:Amidase domain-containing protein n=1 Tax=Pseudidiomarina taiwanensis TaxID=337250 RepID=A0A432ZEM2_9GAMM|nr:amidase family protein [Pseudidiomarina taiwanensis]RUO76354.1 hypothetical protein CWI83_08295 [Pseudidiomarina taiwanensis]